MKDRKDSYIDLHTHSTQSDGSMSPDELVRHAFEAGIQAIALTDHDSMRGVRTAIEQGRSLGIEVIAGVEISVSYATEMHMLGYFFSDNYGLLETVLEELRIKRDQRNRRIIERLNELGIDIALSDAESLAQEGMVGRPHIAQAMVNKGYAGSVKEVFDKYLSFRGLAYFKKEKLTPEEGIQEITKAGGIPVLAHPIYLELDHVGLDNLLERLAGAGLKGIEAYYTYNTPEQTDILLKLAEKHGLAITGGTDFHGSYKPDIEIGSGLGELKVPYRLLAELKKVAVE